jgi:hypothetical protein
LPFNPNTPLLGIYLREELRFVHKCLWFFICSIENNKQTRNLSNIRQYDHIIGYDSIIKKENKTKPRNKQKKDRNKQKH